MVALRTASAGAALFLCAGVLFSACAAQAPAADAAGSGSGGDGGAITGAGGGAPEDGICLLHNCDTDIECAACSDGRTTCLVAEHRCVACTAGTSSGCPDGLTCSSFGQCVPEGLTCPTDANGVPTITCTTSSDCVACDPLHQVCDGVLHACVACTVNDTSECQSTDICLDSTCSPKCPVACQTDNDCAKCGTANAPAHGCNKHKCGECSKTYACPAGESCNLDKGVCERPCGFEGPVAGICDTDADCQGCGPEAPKCHVPLNGGHGTCGPEATGCSDLGNGVLVLPEPWSQVTNTCSNDGDCAGVGIEVNVGKMLRDITGFDEIGDANLSYPMNACAAVEIGQSLSCGVCVPCKVDADCQDIAIDDLSGELFGALGQLGSALLLDQIFGPNDHKIYMYCQDVAAGYGVCAPCPGLLNDCGIGGGGSGSGQCDHEPCAEGGPLDPSCGQCAADVCAVDSYCCSTAWDAVCIGEVDTYCADTCGGGSNCPHDVCTAGDKLNEGCDACTALVCAADPYCCQTAWDSVCVGAASASCGGVSCP